MTSERWEYDTSLPKIRRKPTHRVLLVEKEDSPGKKAFAERFFLQI